MIKSCSRCKIEKEEIEFSPYEFQISSGYCKPCKAVYYTKYKQKILDNARKEGF